MSFRDTADGAATPGMESVPFEDCSLLNHGAKDPFICTTEDDERDKGGGGSEDGEVLMDYG